eukprot:10047782-Karenia_brevis.AAC.1
MLCTVAKKVEVKDEEVWDIAHLMEGYEQKIKALKTQSFPYLIELVQSEGPIEPIAALRTSGPPQGSATVQAPAAAAASTDAETGLGPQHGKWGKKGGTYGYGKGGKKHSE